jgi:hypothetical protein
MTTSFANPFLPINNFFAPASEPEVIPAVDQDDDGSACYALVKNGPPVPSDEVESHLESIEVTVKWGATVMLVKHLTPGQRFVLGEGGDFVMPEEVLGDSRVVIETTNIGTQTVTKTFGEFTVDLVGVRAGKKIPIGFMASLAGGALGAIGLSFLGHTAILASMALFMPSINPDDAEQMDRTQILKMQALLDASAEKEQDRMEDNTAASTDAQGGGSKGGEPHKGESGEAGTTKPVTTKGHMAFKGENAEPQLSRKEQMELAANFGMIGLAGGAVNTQGPASPWSTDDHAGKDKDNRMGAMFGAEPLDQAGFGLGLWGVGEGGGGKGAGIGMDGVGSTIGGGGGGTGQWGIGKGDDGGFGRGHGTVKGGHNAKAPIMRQPAITVNGQLPADAIQRVVRLNFGKFRMCYEDQLKTNPSLQGRVVTKFMIGRDGTVVAAQDGGSDMPNQQVVSCIVRSFQNLSFPTPDGGNVTVTYPLVLSPGE